MKRSSRPSRPKKKKIIRPSVPEEDPISAAPGVGFEEEARQNGFRWIVGIDEAGRGPLAGPVVAAAVILRKTDFTQRIADSKIISRQLRERAFHEILDNAQVGVGVVSETVVDSMNILNATFHAMTIAVTQLVGRLPATITRKKDFDGSVQLLIDGNIFRSELPYARRLIVGGDRRCLSIACASIVAKVIRDRILGAYDRIYPQWGFGQHKGYATREHKAAIQRFGLTPIHRRSFSFKDKISQIRGG